MTAIQFGNDDSVAVIFFDRDSKYCVVIANSLEPLFDALPVASSLKADTIIVVAPFGAGQEIPRLVSDARLSVYEYTK